MNRRKKRLGRLVAVAVLGIGCYLGVLVADKTFHVFGEQTAGKQLTAPKKAVQVVTAVNKPAPKPSSVTKSVYKPNAGKVHKHSSGTSTAKPGKSSADKTSAAGDTASKADSGKTNQGKTVSGETAKQNNNAGKQNNNATQQQNQADSQKALLAMLPAPDPELKGKKLVALTFDDGPDNKWTPKVLDILKNRHLKATFFLQGIQVEKYPDMTKRIMEEGHEIGNHTWNHKQLTKLNQAGVSAQILKADQTLQSVTGHVPLLFRPPYGAASDSVKETIAGTKHIMINWNVDTKDWAGNSVETMMNTVKRQLKPGGVILMHSFGGRHGNLSNTVKLLPELIEYLQSKGYTIVTVPQLLANNNKTAS